MKDNHCITNLLKYICLLQDNSTTSCNSHNGCMKPTLGPNDSSNCFNTRVVSFYKKDGSLFTTSFVNDEKISLSSSTFRVMKVLENSCTLLILNSNNSYQSTGQVITICIPCIGAVRCIEDVTVSNL